MNTLLANSNTQKSKALFVLVFTQLWESFSFYGMRVLLVLYLISELQYMESDAFAIYALYTALIEVGAFAGGYCADRFLGLRKAVLLGGVLIFLGHVGLTLSEMPSLFFLSLGFIIVGSTFFRTNLKVMLGSLYEPEETGREAGFTLFYTGTNIGGFAAALLCGYVADLYGWHLGFGLAAIGMLAGLSFFCMHLKLLSQTEKQTNVACFSSATIVIGALLACVSLGYLLTCYHLSHSFILPLSICLFAYLMRMLAKNLSRQQLVSLTSILGLLIIYFTCEELMGSLLMVFCEKHVERTLCGIEIPSTVLSATNPLIIIICGPFLSYILNRFSIKLGFKLAVAYLFLGCAFLILYLTSLYEGTTAFHIFISFACIALGELFLAPSVYAYCSAIAPSHSKGMMMGLVTMAFAVANLLSGQLSTLGHSSENMNLPSLFSSIAFASLSIGGTLFAIYFIFNYIVKRELFSLKNNQELIL